MPNCGNGDSDPPNKKRKMEAQAEPPVLDLRMSDRLSALPNEILCYILSFLTMRDSIRTRLLSMRWRHLTDYRLVLHFDALNVLGSEETCRACQSRFVRAADQFLDVWKGGNLTGLKVQFCMGNKQASHIDRWVASGLRMKIEDLELNLLSRTRCSEMYVFVDDLLHSSMPINLKSLRLTACVLKFASGCTGWINNLVSLELIFVQLHEKDLKCILSTGLNLTSLSLAYCCKPKFLSINIELPILKKLRLSDDFDRIGLNCPNLETFECEGRAGYFNFSHVPLLTKVDLLLRFHSEGYSSTLDGLARHAPRLQQLSLMVMTEVQPLPRKNFMQCLKRLDLQTDISIGFDLFSITHLLKASPFLEILHLELSFRDYTRQSPQTEYRNRRHFQLKEIKINGFRFTWNEMELAQYLLKNAVALQRMIIDSL